ncbi:FAD binding domain-containing protein [Chloroflexi bacterium TSY]|nr:FAD binding domain-containing protein [Chloroflexi bacterium TSY]
MIRLPPFTYLSPRNLEEAIDLLGEHQTDAMLVAGGTDLYPGMKRRLFTPSKLIALRQLSELKQLSVNQDRKGATLGAGLTLTQVATHPPIMQNYPALAAAAGLVSTPQLRNMGTLGGNLCIDTRCTYYNQSESWRQALGYCMKKEGHICWVAPGSARCLAIQSSDTAPVLIALGAQVRLVGPDGERWLPVEALYQNDGIDYITKQQDEILVEIRLPPSRGIGATYHKLRRRGSFDFPILSVTVALRQQKDGICTQARIVLGAVASAPLRAIEAEEYLIGTKLTDDVIEDAAQQIFQIAKPLDNTDMTLAYRKQMARIYVAKALREAQQTQE